MSQLSQWQITIGGNTVQGAIQWKDEGVSLGAAGQALIVDLTGAGVTGSIAGNTLTINVPGGGGGGSVNSVVAGDGVAVDATDPANPIVSASILADTTKNVPADFPTLDDALAWAKTLTVVNGAQVTITVDDTETISATVAVNGINLPYLHIRGLGVGPTIDGTALTMTPLGVATFIYAVDAQLGEIWGNWRNVNCAGAAFLVGQNSLTKFGSAANSMDVSAGFAVGVFCVGGSHVSENTTLNVGNSNTAYGNQSGATITVINGTTTGIISATNSEINFTDGSIVGDQISAFASNIRFAGGTGTDVTTSFDCSSGSTIAGFLNNFNEPAAGAGNLIQCGGGATFAVTCTSLNLVAGSAANLAVCGSTGNVQFRALAITGASTGGYAIVNEASTFFGSDPLSFAAFAGGASKALYTVDAAGLIVA